MIIYTVIQLLQIFSIKKDGNNKNKENRRMPRRH